MTRLKGYRAKSAREFANIIAPRSYRAALTMHTERDVKWWISRHQDYWPPKVANFMADDPSQWRDKGFSEKKQKELIASMFQEWPQYYWEFLVENGCLQIPKPLFASRLKEVMRRLSPLPPASHLVFWLEGRYNKNYSNAIKLLQQKLGLEPTGLYDMGTAWAVARKIGPWTPARMGYFLHEIIPDTIFEDYDETYIYGIDRDLWRKLGMKDEYLVNDQAEYWQTGGPMVMETSKEFYNIGGYGIDATERTLKNAGEIPKTPELKAVKDIKIDTWHKTGDVFSVLGTAFSMGATAEEMVREGVHDPDAIVTEVIITGVNEIVVEKITGKLVSFSLKLVLTGGNVVVYWIVAFALDYILEKCLGDLVEGVERFFREDFLPFMDRYGENLQASHEKDVEAGIRLD